MNIEACRQRDDGQERGQEQGQGQALRFYRVLGEGNSGGEVAVPRSCPLIETPVC